jgi:hypothetical protein
MFFFPMFWTVYIPILVAVLSLAPEWLMRSLRELGAHAADKSRAVAVAAQELSIPLPGRVELLRHSLSTRVARMSASESGSAFPRVASAFVLRASAGLAAVARERAEAGRSCGLQAAPATQTRIALVPVAKPLH